MFVVFILTWILESLGNPTAIELWHWFGDNLFLTIILLLVFG